MRGDARSHRSVRPVLTGVEGCELLAGQPPFIAETTVGLLYAQVNEPPPPVTDFRPACPAETAGALMRMLEKAPACRWPAVAAGLTTLGGAPLTRHDPIRAQLASLRCRAAMVMGAVLFNTRRDRSFILVSLLRERTGFRLGARVRRVP